MADNFTANQIQGVFGQFKPVLDEAVLGNDFSANNTQGVFGLFVAVLDEDAGVTPAPTAQDALSASIRDLVLSTASRDLTLTADARDFTLTVEAP